MQSPRSPRSSFEESSRGLPAEEYRNLHTRHVLEAHLAKRFSVTPSVATTDSSSTGASNSQLSDAERLRKSRARYATRKALGPGFDTFNLTDNSAVRNPRDNMYSSKDEHNAPIHTALSLLTLDTGVSNYEEDQENNADDVPVGPGLLRIDTAVPVMSYMRSVDTHASVSSDTLSPALSEMLNHVDLYHQHQSHQQSTPHSTQASDEASDTRPTLKSKFSWDSSSDEEQVPSRKSGQYKPRRKSKAMFH
jgi:hypothetical protein